jgi:TolB protein
MRMRVLLVVLALGLVAAPGATALDAQVPSSLVFERNGDLYRMTVDGSEVVRITATKTQEVSPAVSPDGLRVAYARGSDDYATTIWTIAITGEDPRQITRQVTDSDPTWSPDGRHIYFTRYSGNAFGEDCGSIFRIGADGRGLARVTKGSPSDLTPAVSPNGRLLAFTDVDLCAGGTAKLSLGLVDTSGRPTSASARLARATRGSSWQPTWSGDGEHIAFTSLGGNSLFVIRSDGRGRRSLGRALSRAEVRSPAWSPDGEWIAFAAANRKSYDLYLIHPDGTGLRRVTRTNYANEDSPSWLLRS